MQFFAISGSATITDDVILDTLSFVTIISNDIGNRKIKRCTSTEWSRTEHARLERLINNNKTLGLLTRFNSVTVCTNTSCKLEKDQCLAIGPITNAWRMEGYIPQNFPPEQCLLRRTRQAQLDWEFSGDNGWHQTIQNFDLWTLIRNSMGAIRLINSQVQWYTLARSPNVIHLLTIIKLAEMTTSFW